METSFCNPAFPLAVYFVLQSYYIYSFLPSTAFEKYYGSLTDFECTESEVSMFRLMAFWAAMNLLAMMAFAWGHRESPHQLSSVAVVTFLYVFSSAVGLNFVRSTKNFGQKVPEEHLRATFLSLALLILLGRSIARYTPSWNRYHEGKAATYALRLVALVGTLAYIGLTTTSMRNMTTANVTPYLVHTHKWTTHHFGMMVVLSAYTSLFGSMRDIKRMLSFWMFAIMIRNFFLQSDQLTYRAKSAAALADALITSACGLGVMGGERTFGIRTVKVD